MNEAILLNVMNDIFQRLDGSSYAAFTQKLIALEAGIGRATFNRYPIAVAEYRRLKQELRSQNLRKTSPPGWENAHSADAIDSATKNEELVTENVLALKAARQEIYVLNMALRKLELELNARSKNISDLTKSLSKYEKLYGIRTTKPHSG